MTFLATYSNGVQVSSPTVGADINGSATLIFTPTIAGTITQAFIGSTCTPFPVTPSVATITQVTTTTQISTPNTSSVGQRSQILVTVQSASPSAYAPTGQVVVRNANGAVLQTMGLTAGPGNGQSFAYFRWTPTQAGTFFFQATYNGDSNATTSTSPQDTSSSTPSGNTISLTAPSTMTQGVPVNSGRHRRSRRCPGLGRLHPERRADQRVHPDRQRRRHVPVDSERRRPGDPRCQLHDQSGRLGIDHRSRDDRAPVPTQTDVISLVQPGWGPWNPGGTYTLGNGSSFAFQATTLSGAGVTLSESGPCQVSGLTITIDTGSGQCNLVATSPGGNGYRGVQQGYTVSIIPGNQTAALAAPNSGNFSKGRTIRLQNPSQGQTNAGQNVTWRVTSGGNRCRIRYPSSGAVNLQLQRAGTCNVVARAPGVAGQWNQFRLERSYRAR